MKAKDNKPTNFILPPQIAQKDLASYKKKYGFTEIAQLGFGLTYKAKWDTWSAIREFVQNAFDVITENHRDRKKLSSVLLEYNASKNIGYIADDEGGIKYRNMFLAETKEQTTSGIDCLRGKFGEGMKFALIPLLRDGHSVIIRTVGFDYHFCSVLMGQDDFDLIHLFQLPNKIKTGTCIAIQSVDPTSYRDNFVPLRLADHPEDLLLEDKAGCRVRQALKKTGENGKFYIRDIFICEINSLYDYNFWFKDPTRVLDPDRSSIRLETRLESFLREFICLFDKIDAPEGNIFWAQLFQTMLRDKNPKDFFEFTILNFSSDGDCSINRIAVGEEIFKCLKDILKTETFGWSQDYRGGKELEHHGVVDLQDKLPDLSYWLGDWVLTPAKIKNLQHLRSKNRIIVVPEDFASLGENAVTAVKHLYSRLLLLADEVCTQVANANGPPIYLYIGEFEDSRIGHSGYTNYEVVNLNWEIIHRAMQKISKPPRRWIKRRGKRLIRRTSGRRLKHIAEDATLELVKTLLHELSHYCCHQLDNHQECGDLTESFENTMEDIMMSFAQITRSLISEEDRYMPLVTTKLPSIAQCIATLLTATKSSPRKMAQIEKMWKEATDRAAREKTIDVLIEDPFVWDSSNRRKVTPSDVAENRHRLVQRALRSLKKSKVG